MPWTVRCWCFCLFYLSSLLFAITRESRGARWESGQAMLPGIGGTAPLALQMCIFTPPAFPEQVRLVLTGCDSCASLLWTYFRTLALLPPRSGFVVRYVDQVRHSGKSKITSA